MGYKIKVGGGGGGGATKSVARSGTRGLGSFGGNTGGGTMGKLESGWDRISGQKGQRMKDADYQESVKNQYDAEQGVLGQMKNDDDAYANKMEGISGKYKLDRDVAANDLRRKRDEITEQAKSQANDATKTYQTVSKEQTNIMEDAKKEAGSAMTLADAGDPNNKVQTAVRGMYDQQGQGVMRQGVADAGVLSALGAQSAASQFGGLPMTGGQMQAMFAQSQGLAAQAAARAQQNMQRLKEQGIDAGFRESDAQYERGQRAKDRYSGSVKDIQNSRETYDNRMGQYRDEFRGDANDRYGLDQGIAAENLGLDAGNAGLRHGLSEGQSQRQLASVGQRYGNQQQGIANSMAAANANTQMYAGMIGQIGGAAAGGYFGGPAGASAGAAAGGKLAEGVTGGNQPPPQPTGGVASQMNQQPPAGGGGGYGYYGNGAQMGPPAPQRAYSPGAYGGGYGPNYASNRR